LATVNQVGSSGLGEGRGTGFVGRYRVIRRLGGGSAGETYLAEDKDSRERVQERVVVKLLHDDGAKRQLRTEFARLTELSHPNIVSVLDAGVAAGGFAAGRAFIITRYVAGSTLAESLPDGSSAERFKRFALAAEALTDALAYLHGRAILHGDISPANVRCDQAGNPILIDFGLSRRPARSIATVKPSVSGTLGFVAPEALLGELGPAGDLFSLAATLYDAWTGTPPFGVGMEAVKRAWQGPPEPPSSLRPGLPPAWDHLLLRLLAAPVEQRPGSAREALREIRRGVPGRATSVEEDLGVPFPAGDPLAGVFVGRAAEMEVLRFHLERLAEGVSPASVVSVVGPSGTGRRCLIRQALREARLSILSQSFAAFDIEEDECSRLMAREPAAIEPAEVEPEPARRTQGERARVVTALEKRALTRPLCLVLAGSPEDEVLAAAVASNPPSGRLLVLLPAEHAIERAESVVLRPSHLSPESIAELARRAVGLEPPAEVVERIVAVSSGLPSIAALLVRGWIKNLCGGRSGAPGAVEGLEGNRDLAQLLDASLAGMSAEARAFVVALALGREGEPTTPEHESAHSEAAEREVFLSGWVLPGAANLPSEAHWAAVWRALARDGRLQTVARAAAALLPPGEVRVGEVRLALGEHHEAAAIFWQAMRDAQATMAWSRVAELGLRARAADEESGTWRDWLCLATGLGILGRYDEALAVLDARSVEPESGTLAAMAERRAWLLGRRGDPEAALVVLQSALRSMGADSEASCLLRARMASMLVASGRFDEAFAAVEPALRVVSTAGTAARESAALALAYAGKLSEARRLLDALRTEAGAGQDHRLAARTAGLEGLIAQFAGQPGPAATAFQRSAAEYERIRDVHGSAAATFNYGCILAEIGDYAGAIDALERAIRELGRLDVRTDHALAVFNVGQVFLALGDGESAERAIERLQEEARVSRVEAFRGYGLLLKAELQRKRCALDDCARTYLAAKDAFANLGMQVMIDHAALGRAEVLAEQGAVADAYLAWSEVARRNSAASGTEAPMAEAILLVRGRIVLLDHEASDVASVAEALSKSCASAKDSGRLPAAWRMASLASRLFARANDARAEAQLDVARTLFEEVKMKTPAPYWPSIESDGDAKILKLRGSDTKAATEWVERATLLEGRLRRLLRINKRLNSDLRLSRVLETIIDTVIELTDAERGFLLLKDGDGELVVKVARNIDQTSLEGPSSSLSRSIAKKAADSGEPVIAVDAAGDNRFSEMLSVSDLHLRSVLAVPLTVKGSVVGTIYVDHRLRKGVFGEEELAMVLDFAEQGAIAIENARVVAELRRREQQVQSLNRRLERDLRAQEEVLTDVRVQLKESQQVAALRYDYRQIVGQAPAMLDLFRILDRVTDTTLPVVIEGESGTGKELVARAIHFHGPRKAKPFISENCAAIPETLLESALFGHARGAFTGADREARGMFAIADGGTLFLDEVAEMSPAMQGKLLRVLQEGEFHRIGSERTEKADVRVLVATNKNLGQMVEEGRFRKDLFYRLSVVRLHLPPLRERREDIPLLLRHFLDKASRPAGSEPKRMEPAALAKLCAYAWPGNVRELENEIARAGAFAGDTITVADLSTHIQAGQDPVEAIRNEPDSLRLRSRVERLERQLVREAMNRSQGNQTRASALLGLSRFGLQKKLRRYNLGG
jgi:transcriptional regulator with GAF, ATPase, and Fis domain/tetratricopeptide (TPR) repeat protein